MTHLLRPGEVAERLGISTASLMNIVRGGQGPRCVRVAGCVRFAEGDLDAWIGGTTVSVASEGSGSR